MLCDPDRVISNVVEFNTVSVQFFKCSSCFAFLAAPGSTAFKSYCKCSHHFCQNCKKEGKGEKYCKKSKCLGFESVFSQMTSVDLRPKFELAYQGLVTNPDEPRCEVHKQHTHIGGMICLSEDCPHPEDGFRCSNCEVADKRHAGCDQQLDAKELISKIAVKSSRISRLCFQAKSRAAELCYDPKSFTEVWTRISRHLQKLSNLPDQFTSETFKIDYSFKKEGDYIIVHDKVLEEVEKILVEMLACQSTKADKLKFAKLFTAMAKCLRVVDQKLASIPKCHKSKQSEPIKAPKDVIGEDSDWEGLHEEEDQKDPEADPEDGDVMGMDDRGVDHMDASQHDDDKHLSTTKCCLCDSEDPNTKVIRTFAEDVSELAASQPSGTNHVLQVTGEGSIK